MPGRARLQPPLCGVAAGSRASASLDGCRAVALGVFNQRLIGILIARERHELRDLSEERRCPLCIIPWQPRGGCSSSARWRSPEKPETLPSRVCLCPSR